MTAEQLPSADGRVDAAIAELRGMIEARYPDATFDVAPGDDPVGIYLTATVDVEDPDEVFDIVVGRLLDMQVEEGLPVYVIAIRPVERTLAELAQQRLLAPLPR